MGKTIKIVVCGMKSVGKTALLEQLIYGNVNFNTEIHPTIEDTYVALIESDKGIREKIRFYDTAGLEPLQNTINNQQLPRHYLGFADGFILVYDTAKPESLDVLMPLKKDIEKNKEKKDLTVMVIGNRTQYNFDHPILENTANKALNWCNREKIRHFEVNLMDRSTLFKAFVYLSSRATPPQTKTSFPQLSMGRKTGKTEQS